MARTCRRYLDWSKRITDRLGWSGTLEVIMYNRDNGYMHGGRLGSAHEGKMNSYDDCGKGFPKNRANKQIRNWHKKQTKVQLQEHYESTEELRQELQALDDEIETYYDELDDRDDYFLDPIREANEDYWESKYDEYFEDMDE